MLILTVFTQNIIVNGQQLFIQRVIIAHHAAFIRADYQSNFFFYGRVEVVASEVCRQRCQHGHLHLDSTDS